MTLQSFNPKRLFLATLALSLAGGCDLPTVDDDANAGDDGASTGAAPADDGAGDEPAGESSGGEDGDPDGDSSGDAPGDDDGDGDTGDSDGVVDCSQGQLLIGNPFGDPAAWPSDGAQSIDATDDAPGIPVRGIQASPVDDTKLVFASGPEIWFYDRSDEAVHRILGDHEAGEFAAGPCAQARVGNVSDLAFRSDGTLILGDHGGNAVVRVTDPFGPACEMHYYAGTQTATSTGPLPHEPGFDDGPGASATFSGPDFLTVGSDDTIYVVDKGNLAVRAIDTDGVVSTVAVLPAEYVSNSLAAFDIVALDDGRLYLPVKGSVRSAQNATILEIDPGNGGALREVVTGRDDPWLVGSTGPSIAGLVETEPGVLATYVNGRIFTIDAEDGTVEHIAGDGDKPWTLSDYAAGYDPMAAHPALELELDNHSATTTGAAAFVSWVGDALIVTGQAEGFTAVQIACD